MIDDDKDRQLAALAAELAHWKANHADMVKRAALLAERPDLPVDRIPAYRELARLQERNAELAADAAEDDALRQRMTELLKGVANGLKGAPRPLHSHDWSDLPARAAEAADRLRGIKEAAGAFACWWAMVEAQEELAGMPIPDSATILHFMGSGASTMVTAGQIRAMLAAIYEVKP